VLIARRRSHPFGVRVRPCRGDIVTIDDTGEWLTYAEAGKRLAASQQQRGIVPTSWVGAADP
jgi:hypothetical protein